MIWVKSADRCRWTADKVKITDHFSKSGKPLASLTGLKADLPQSTQPLFGQYTALDG
ncbi:hypothetical protein [Parvularcula maris]|uniref:Uncharacterized protein n=1 Tax=Parvularcula maris TaxID=2965077 RepID=A0A9X2RGB7_9PROT|nr:hypothetical protein [Parvularcula maris]MCQ8183809.1 hypothetical protein [Parvularcula maris]